MSAFEVPVGRPLALVEAELDYAQITSNGTSTATTSASATAVITGSAITLDGATQIFVEFSCAYMEGPSNATCIVVLYDGSTELMHLVYQDSGSGGVLQVPAYGKVKLTPSAGSHTYSARVYGGAGTKVIGAGTGASGQFTPAFLRVTRAENSLPRSDGWVDANETWTYASADDPSYTFTIAGVDLTTRYSPGMRVRLSQATGGTKYGIITKVAFSTDTTVTIYMGTDYDLVNEAISAPYYSMLKAPFGFPLDAVKWTHSLLNDTSDRTADPAQDVFGNPGSISGDLPIGSWFMSYVIVFDIDASATSALQYAVSTSNSSVSDVRLAGQVQVGGRLQSSQERGHVPVAVTAKTTYYPIAKNATQNPTFVNTRGDILATRVWAVSAYL